MGKAILQKIRITGLNKHYKILLQELHRDGNLQIVENTEFIQNSVKRVDQHFTVFDLARIDFAIQFLEPYGPKVPFLDKIFAGGKIILTEAEAKERLKKITPESENIISACEQIAYKRGQAEHEIVKINEQLEQLNLLKAFPLALEKHFNTDSSQTIIGFLPKSKKTALITTMAKESRLADIEYIQRDKNNGIIRISFHNSIEEKIKDILKTFEIKAIDFGKEWSEWVGKTPREIIRHLEKEKKAKQKQILAYTEEQKKLAHHVEDLKILSDYNEWRKKRHDLQHKILKTNQVFAFEAWIPASKVDSLEKWILNSFVQEVSLEKIEANKNEEIPVLVQNKKGIASFEFITEMFGIPDNKDLDPTPFLAPFFFVFFGLCLSDVGYGGILALGALLFLSFGKMSQLAKSGVLLLFLCGISAIAGGVILGGYFGMVPEVVPQWLGNIILNPAYEAGVAESIMPFKGQLINPMSGSGPITFLILTLIIGVVQLLFGVFLDICKKIKNKDYLDAFCDPFAWFVLLSSIVFFVMTTALESFAGYKEIAKNMVLIGALFLVLTQGRDQKNWLLKPISGILGLYNITGYLSDVLSYSRIMALGLATGVIGFAMNLTAGVLFEMMPHWTLGILVAVIIILFGHSLNFALSLLGAFVHSGRLQFIEFFGKFFDGNGQKFTPFHRQKKYIFFQKD